MTADERSHIEHLCLEAAGHDTDERMDFLAGALAGRSPSFREAVHEGLRSLLDADLKHVGFLEKPPQQHLTSSQTPIDATTGPFRILETLGEGGMGIVYKAEQQSPRRIVALKVLKPGLETPQFLSRFAREAESLGRLQHPGISRIYNAGTLQDFTGPRPYISMEYVDGKPLAASVGDVRTRLELLAQVCDALEHAHLRGIIHRDLKPNNILVDRAGQPRILDFGVARITDADLHPTRHTDLGQLIGTLAYMSPEQSAGDPAEVDFRTDIYSLGVVLYELLAGKLPYQTDRRALPEAVRAIREDTPAMLSVLDRAYRGDIETIVGKALEKNRDRRYESAAAMADDIRRYLSDRPIVARPPTAAYQLRKFVRRNRKFVAALGALIAVLVLAVIVSTMLAIRAQKAERVARQAEQSALEDRAVASSAGNLARIGQEMARAAQARAEQEQAGAARLRLRADREAASAIAVTNFLANDVLAQADAQQQSGPPDRDLKIRTALDRAARSMDQTFKDQPEVEAALRETIGWAYRGLGVLPEARIQLDRAVELRFHQLGAADPKTLEARSRQGQVISDQGKFEEALAVLLPTLALQRRTPGAAQVETMERIAAVYFKQAKNAPAEALRLEALEIGRRLLGPEHPNTLMAMLNLAASYRQRGAYRQAESLIREPLAIRTRTLGPDHPSTVDCAYSLALVLNAWGKLDEARPLLIQSVDSFRRIRGPEHPLTLDAIGNLAQLEMHVGRNTQAEALCAEILEARRRTLGPTHQATMVAMHQLGLVYTAEGNYGKAEALLRQTSELRQKHLNRDHPQTSRSMYDLAEALRFQRKFDEADKLYDQALASRLKSRRPDDEITLLIRNAMANSFREQRRYAEAEAVLGAVLEISHRVNEHTPFTMGKHEADLALIFWEQGKFKDGERLAREALAIGEKNEPQGWRRFASESLLGACLAGQDRYSEAEPFLLRGWKGLDARRETIAAQDRYWGEQAHQWAVAMYKGWWKPEYAESLKSTARTEVISPSLAS